MSKVISKEYFHGKKCACGRRYMMFYAFEGDEKEFDELGLCGQCFAELLEEFDYEVLKPKEVRQFVDRFNAKKESILNKFASLLKSQGGKK